MQRKMTLKEKAWLLTRTDCMINPYGCWVLSSMFPLHEVCFISSMNYLLIGHPTHHNPHPMSITDDTDMSIFKPDSNDKTTPPYHYDDIKEHELYCLLKAHIDTSFMYPPNFDDLKDKGIVPQDFSIDTEMIDELEGNQTWSYGLEDKN